MLLASMLTRFLCLLLSALLVFTHDPGLLYNNVKVLRIPTGPDTSKLESLVSQYRLNVWTDHMIPNSHLDVEVPSEKCPNFKTAVDGILKEEGITMPIITMHEDLGESIRKESEGMVPASQLRNKVGAVASPSWFDGYHSYDDHLAFLNDLVAQFPNNAKIVSSGESLEGRDIKGVHIFGSSGAGNKPAIIWHGTVHAREWISTMVTEYLAYSLLTEYRRSAEVKAYVDKYDFYIFPLVNPDGFVYSQSVDRLWRKNRQPPPSGSTCYGRDINRNWDIQWSTPNGASTNPCAQDYKGEAPADAPETHALSGFINRLAESPAGAKMYIDWHSYSQLFMFPYGYDCGKVSDDITELSILASGFSAIVSTTNGAAFRGGPICLTVYPVTGSSVDYTYDVSKIKYSFAAELRDVGLNGFVLPPEQIHPSGQEIWAGVKYLLANIK